MFLRLTGEQKMSRVMFLSPPQPFHYGLVNVSDGKCRPQPARLKVCPDLLVLQREEFVFPEEDDGLDNKVRRNQP